MSESTLKPKTCGKCGSGRLDAVSPFAESTVVCLQCHSLWWKQWYTRAEWEDYVNVVDGVDYRKERIA
jgi:hypothetical protein